MNKIKEKVAALTSKVNAKYVAAGVGIATMLASSPVFAQGGADVDYSVVTTAVTDAVKGVKGEIAKIVPIVAGLAFTVWGIRKLIYLTKGASG